MRLRLYNKSIFVVLSLLGVCTAHAETAVSACSNKLSINSIHGVLYKPENLHGARGPTFLVQNPIYRTKKKKIEIRDINCKKISSFGLFSTDYPYGARYYQKSGGSKHSARQLYQLAQKAGSATILVELSKERWAVVQNPLKREGKIYSE